MRVSATTLEAFRLYLEEDWLSEEDFLAQVRGEAPATPRMRLGQAFGRILEAPDRYRVEAGTYTVPDCGPWRFPAETVAPALDAIDRDRTLFEVPGVVRFGRHEVACRADQLCGADLVETKTTLDAPRLERYLDSYQWRYMALAFEPAVITYRVYWLDEQADGLVWLRDVEQCRCYPYPTLRADGGALLREFVRYAECRGLVDLLERAQAERSGGWSDDA